MNILSTGHLFVAGEASNHIFYNFNSTGDNEEHPVFCISQQSVDYDKEFNKEESKTKSEVLPTFSPREPKNLEAKDELMNLAPINDMKVEDLTGERTA